MRDYVLTLLVTAAVTYMLTPLVRRLASRVGAIKEPQGPGRARRARSRCSAAWPCTAGSPRACWSPTRSRSCGTAFANTGMVSGLLLAGGLLVVIGIIDDRWGMSPLTKAAGQVAAGGILVATGHAAELAAAAGRQYVSSRRPTRPRC